MTDREQTPPLDCKCLTWCRDYGIGRHTERHHRVCPKWYEHLGTAYRTRTELIVTGNPGDDENHNCDAMGCSSVSHVLLRLPLASDPAAHVSGAQGDGGTGGVLVSAPTVFDELMAFEEASEVQPTFADAVRIALAAKKRASGAALPTQAKRDADFLRGFISRSGRPGDDAMLAHCAVERLASGVDLPDGAKHG